MAESWLNSLGVLGGNTGGPNEDGVLDGSCGGPISAAGSRTRCSLVLGGAGLVPEWSPSVADMEYMLSFSEYTGGISRSNPASSWLSA